VRLSLFLALSLAFGSCGQSSSHTEQTGERHVRSRPRTEETPSTALPAPQPSRGGGLVYEETSEYSHFKVYDRGGTRYLMFVRDNGQEVTESALELSDPDRLAIEYTQVMFASHLLRPEQQRVLIVGLGGGSMVRFLRRFFPEIDVTAVEIDPAIARVAESYFGVVNGPNTHIVVEDGFDFIARGGDDYDVVYMDAFLKPSTSTDDEGAPLNMQAAVPAADPGPPRPGRHPRDQHQRAGRHAERHRSVAQRLPERLPLRGRRQPDRRRVDGPRTRPEVHHAPQRPPHRRARRLRLLVRGDGRAHHRGMTAQIEAEWTLVMQRNGATVYERPGLLISRLEGDGFLIGAARTAEGFSWLEAHLGFCWF
jgi:predicted O-methyltransferase YrrM